jgi:hypothetical protein
MECIFQLLTFGIAREAIPIRDDGSDDLFHHHKLIETLRLKEAAKKNKGAQKQRGPVSASMSSVTACSSSHKESAPPITAEEEEDGDPILIPSPMDVLLGRGRQPKSRPGSLRMYSILHENMAAYEATTLAGEKTEIAMKVIKEMKASGCRFLRVEGGYYKEIDDRTARAKIAHGFRSLRKNKKKKEDGTTTSGSTTRHHAAEGSVVNSKKKKRNVSD